MECLLNGESTEADTAAGGPASSQTSLNQGIVDLNEPEDFEAFEIGETLYVPQISTEGFLMVGAMRPVHSENEEVLHF